MHASQRYQSGNSSPRGDKKSFNHNRSNRTQGPWCIGPLGPHGMPNETDFKMKACKFNRNTHQIHNMFHQFLFHIFELKAISDMRISFSTANLPVIYRSQWIFLPSIFLRWCLSCKKGSISETHEIRTRNRMRQKHRGGNNRSGHKGFRARLEPKGGGIQPKH